MVTWKHRAKLQLPNFLPVPSINNSHPPNVIRCALGALEPLHQRSAHVPCGARRPSAQRGIHPPAGLVRRQPEGPQRVRRPGGHRHPRRREENR